MVLLIIGETEPVSAFVVIVMISLISVSKIRTFVHNITSVKKRTSFSFCNFRRE